MNTSIEHIIATITSLKLHLGVISTVTENNKPEAATVYFTIDNDLNVYFVTRTGSRKYKNLMQNPHAAFVMFNEHPPKTVQLEGVVSIVSDPHTQRDLFPELITFATESNLIPPVSQMMNSEIMFMKITTTWARLGNFELAREGDMFHEVTKE